MFDSSTDRTDPPEAPADRFGLIVMAASAGGLWAYRQIVSALPPDFPAPVVLVQHMTQDQPSLMADILARHTQLRVGQAREGDVLCPGTIYTPAPGRHLVVRGDGTVSLSQGPRVNFARPSADVLFESAAAAFGERVVGVVLTGGGCDGAAGVRAIRRRGGFVIAQDEATAEDFWMPYNAVLTRKVDLVLPVNRIAFALQTLTGCGAANAR